MNFGSYLKKQRTQQDWTQPIAASKMGIEQSYLSKLETGKSYPSEDIFNNIVEVYDIDIVDMSTQIDSEELDKLREIKEVRCVVLKKQKSTKTFIRRWMIAGVVFLMLGGACFATAIIPKSTELHFYYRSEGVLLPGEVLTTFNIIVQPIDSLESTKAELKELLAKQKEMINRIEQNDITTKSFQGTNFVENVEKGKRYYQLYDSRELAYSSPLQWFLIPALMFLMGGVGCFRAGARWK